ncbi:MAG: helix-turn-helix domain-containing protein [Snowella sp.]
MVISQSSRTIDITQAQDNIFADLGFSEEEAVNLKIRADLMLELRSFIKAKGWTQKDAASFFDETQPRISCLMNGDINRFSVDKLLLMLSKAGMAVRFEVVSHFTGEVENG